MIRTLFAKALLCVVIGVGFLPLSMFLREELRTSVGGTPTGEVFVPRESEAARRGYALPGEGTGPANLIGGQFDRSEKVRTLSVVTIVVGLIISASSLMARRLRGTNIGTNKGDLGILGRMFGNCFGALFVGGFGGFLIFAPLKALPDSVFDAVFTILCIGVVLVIFLKRIEVSQLVS